MQFDEPSAALCLAEMPVPHAGPGELLVKVLSCGLNFADALMCRGRYQRNPAPGFTPGLEICGIVDSANDALHGRRVCAPTLLPAGGLGEYCLVRRAFAYPVPSVMDNEQGAALTVAFETAWIALMHNARLQPGETVLIHAGAGGVGSAAIQIARAKGCVVLATAGSADKLAVCRQLGAHEVYDYEAPNFVEALRTRAGGGVDVVLDSVGGDVFDASLRVVNPEARVVVIGFSAGRIPDLAVNRLLLKNCSVSGMQVDYFRSKHVKLLHACHRDLDDMLTRGLIVPLIGAVFGFDEAPSAISALERRQTVGKVVVSVAM